MRRFCGALLAISSGVTMLGCADRANVSPMPSISKEAEAGLEKKVNCKTATGDIATLEAERASVQRQLLAGARAVFPISAAAGILSGDYNSRVQVATGQYNRDITEKIEEIRRTCKMHKGQTHKSSDARSG